MWGRKSSNTQLKDITIRIGQVISVDDEYHGLRIKARLDQDNNIVDADVPYAFPLLPKTIQVVPKVGEAVLILLSQLSNKDSIRYYIGPLLSQPQYYYDERYNNGFGTSASLIQGSTTLPLETIDHYNETKGAFPNTNDIALVGRKSEDIILKDGEIDIRCGIRGKKFNDSIDTLGRLDETKALQGDVIFNTQSPAYLQLKYKRGICKGNNQIADSVINIVADKINLISHQDTEYFNLTDQEQLIHEDDIDNIMSKLHCVPYGDVLRDVLQAMITAISSHVHSFPGLPPIQGQAIINMLGQNLDDMVSPNVRIS